MKRKYLIYIMILLMVLVVLYFIFRKNDVTIEEDVYTDDSIKEELLAMINSDKVSSKITSIMHGMDKINLMDTDVSIVNGEIKITDKNGKKLSKKSEIPPEAVIYASRNSPKNGWLIPLITSIITFITTCLTFYGTIISLSK